MIKVKPYTYLELESIANEIRKFAESDEYEHVTKGNGKHKTLTVHNLPMSRHMKNHLRLMASTIEHNIHI
jgi:hypothetical protein